MSGPGQGFLVECEARLTAIAAICAARLGIPQPNLSDEQRSALRTAIEIVGDSARRGLATATIDESLEAVVAVERLGLLVHDIVAQHADPDLGPGLSLAEECLASAYARAVEAFPGKLSPAHPIMLLEAHSTPVIYCSEASVFVGRVGEARGKVQLSFPILIYPPGDVLSLASFPLLLHELAHHIIRALGLEAQAKETLVASGLPARSLTRWRWWCGEALADLIGATLGGPGILQQFYAMLNRHAGSSRLAASDTHPAVVLRVAILLAFHARQGVPVPPATVTTPADPHTPEIDQILDALCPLLVPLTALPNEHELLTDAVQWLQSGPPRAPPPALPRRLLPTAALSSQHMALDDPGILQLRTVAFTWALPPEAWEFVRDKIRSMVPTILAAGDGQARKVPPLELLKAHDTISFLGLNHWQLVARLTMARDARASKQWSRIEVFYPDDDTLRALMRVLPAKDLIAEKRRTIADLSACLPGMAARWTIYEHSSGPMMASFWDCEDQPRGRARMHLSPYAWGQDIATCPSFDFVAEPDGRWPQMLAVHVDGLQTLRCSARMLHSGGE